MVESQYGLGEQFGHVYTRTPIVWVDRKANDTFSECAPYKRNRALGPRANEVHVHFVFHMRSQNVSSRIIATQYESQA